MQPLEVTLFGGFTLRRGGEVVPPIASRVGRSLFAYLAVQAGVALPRERLVNEFWPELSESRGRRRLSHTLWQLQDALSELPGEASYLDVGTDTLALGMSAPVTVDVQEFERGLDELRHLRTSTTVRSRDLPRLEQVVELYRGDLLDGHYEPWVRDEQERLAQRYLEALATLVTMAKRLGAYDDALVYARRITHQDPLREDGHREVMRLSMLLGRPSEALRQFERCREVLAEELGADPSPSTIELHARILRQGRGDAVARAEPVPFPDRIPLVGRDRERAAALEVIDAALGGRGGGVLVEGQPGQGKTRLLEELVDDAGWRGFALSSARGSGSGGTEPFALVRGLLAETLTPLRLEHLRHRVEPVWLAEVARLVPSVARAVPPGSVATPRLRGDEGAQRMRDAVVRVLLALTDVDPLLIVLDDVQDADSDSLSVLAGLATSLPDHPGVLLLGYRGEEARHRPEVWQVIQELDRELRPARLVLGPLDVFSIGEVTRVVAQGQRIDPSAAARLRDETGGNPLFVVETLRELADQGQLGALEEDAAQLPLPGSIRELVLARTERLSAVARTVLDLSAVAGDRIDLDTLEAASELPRATVVDGVDLLVRWSLLRELGEGFTAHHDQIRRACLDALDREARRALHRRLGEALEQHHPDAVERLAGHFEAAGLGRRAVGYLVSAGRRAVSLHAYAAARDAFSRAAQLQRQGPFRVEDRVALLQDLEDVLDVLGERDEQHRVLAELAELAGGEAAMVAEVARRSALLRAALGAPGDAVDDADRAIAIAQDLGDPAVLSRAVRAAASVRAWAGRPDAALPLWDRAIELASTPVSLAEARTMRASVLRELHRYDDAVTELETALAVAEQGGELREEARALGVLGAIRMELGDSGAAVELYRRSLERCERIGFRRGERINLTNLGNVLYGRGELLAALDAYQRAASIAQAIGDASGLAAARINLGVVRHTVLGQDELARRDLEAALTHFEPVGAARFVAACHESLAGVALRAGELDRAQEHIQAGEAAITGNDDAWSGVPLLLRRAELALARDELEAALTAATEALQAAEEHRLRDLLPGALALLARSHLAVDDAERAARLADDAVGALAEGAERPYLIHLVHHDALAAAGRDREARTALAAAVAALEAMLAGLDEGDRVVALAVPEHARLAALAAQVTPRRIRVEVAASGAPLGRPLGPEDLVEVEVVLDPSAAPSDPVARRRHDLRSAVAQVIDQGGAVTVTDLAGILAASEATIRRDLAALRSEGTHVATRGARAG